MTVCRRLGSKKNVKRKDEGKFYWLVFPNETDFVNSLIQKLTSLSRELTS